jgi:hypothetical protein
MRTLIVKYALIHDIPEALLHAVIQRESDYRANARNGPYYGLMQILPQTARGMGFEGAPSDLLAAETSLNLRWTLSARRVAAFGWRYRHRRWMVRPRLLLRSSRSLFAG